MISCIVVKYFKGDGMENIQRDSPNTEAMNTLTTADKIAEKRGLKQENAKKELNWRSRSVQITINDPVAKGFTHEVILHIAGLLNVRCMAMVDEIGYKSQLLHTHIFMYRDNAMASSRLQHLFPSAHLEKCKGTALENRDYLRKTGTDANIAKAGTQVPGSYFEWGDWPEPAEERNPRMYQLVDMVRQGMTDEEILAQDPSYALSIRNIHDLRESLRGDKYNSEKRDVIVTYVFGGTQLQRTRYVYDRHDMRDIARHIGEHDKKVYFDEYSGEDVLILDTMAGIPVNLLLSMMQGYPISLPARYRGRVAHYHYLYILEQFSPAQLWKALSPLQLSELLDSLTKIVEIDATGSSKETKV